MSKRSPPSALTRLPKTACSDEPRRENGRIPHQIGKSPKLSKVAIDSHRKAAWRQGSVPTKLIRMPRSPFSLLQPGQAGYFRLTPGSARIFLFFKQATLLRIPAPNNPSLVFTTLQNGIALGHFVAPTYRAAARGAKAGSSASDGGSAPDAKADPRPGNASPFSLFVPFCCLLLKIHQARLSSVASAEEDPIRVHSCPFGRFNRPLSAFNLAGFCVLADFGSSRSRPDRGIFRPALS